MKIILAKSAGFCMGVRRAVEMVLDASRKSASHIYTYGPLIHNPQVLSILKERGITVLDDLPDKGSGTILIRAHGVPPQTKRCLGEAGFTVIDATCPHVVKVQTIIRKHTHQGYASIIIGDKDHPEVVGLLGYAGDAGYVVGTIEELRALPIFEKAIVVAQTTQNSGFFQKVQEDVRRMAPHYEIFNTICDSTERRQAEVTQLADHVDAVIVVGGHNSGNTDRLAQIVRQSGKTILHVETEAELDSEALASAQSIGITAGASTPNWIIKKVYRTLEGMLIEKKRGWRSVLFNLQRTVLLTSIYLSFGAGGIGYAAMKLQGFDPSFSLVFVAMLYVLSMHIFNHLTGTKADQYNDPDRASFYKTHRVPLAFLAVTAGGVGLIMAYWVGRVPFLILAAMSIMGVSYNRRLVPSWLSAGPIRRIRDIPGSKTILIALAWGMATAVVPSIALSKTITFGTLLAFLWATCLVFVRTAFFDILDIHGDRIVGRETIPILIGEKRTLRLLKWILTCSIGMLLISSLFHLIAPLGYFLIVCAVSLYMMLLAHEQGRMLPGIGLEFLIETHLVSCGVIAWIGSMILFGGA